MKCCVIFACNDLEKKEPVMDNNAVNSFLKWHPDIELKLVNESVNGDFWLWRIQYVRDLFDKGYKKVIMLGADTITCNHFDEFFDDDSTSFLSTSDYQCIPDKFLNEHNLLIIPNRGVMEIQYINSDVSCFNNCKILDRLIEIMKSEKCHDNDAMNYVNCDLKYKNDIKIVDFPYKFKTFTYNLRGFGILGSECIKNDGVFFGFDGPIVSYMSPLKMWSVMDNKLYNHDGKLVKCIHLASYKNDGNKLFSDSVYKWLSTECNSNFE